MRGSPEEFIQRFVHALETGNLMPWIRRTLVAAILGIMVVVYLYNFKGLATSQAMDQAQIGRSIATGRGWHTQVIRPRAIAQLRAHGKDVARKIGIDTYHAPLPPLIDAIAIFPVKSHVMGLHEQVSLQDKAIVLMSLLLFFASVFILFFLVRRLFDERLAVLTCVLVLICDLLWQYSLSGLPQMLLLLFFNTTLYAFVRAIEAHYRGGTVGPWLAAIGAGFGLMALTHALTIWMFLPAFIFCVFYFRPRGWAAVIILGSFLLIYTPWLIRTFVVCGSPAGTAIYSALDGLGHSEAGWMRQLGFDLAGVTVSAVRDKIMNNLLSQTGRIFEYLGWSVVALSFFFSLLHSFRRSEAAALRWFVLCLWGGVVLGMAVSGIREEHGVAANQFYPLFIPIMTCFGLAYLLVQWNRLGIGDPLARPAFITGLFLLCGLPMIYSFCNMLLFATALFHYPPYIPPAIAYLNKWMNPNEIIASDIPEAISWYADRETILVPDQIQVLTDLNDYGTLGAKINGLYLTPVSGTQNKVGDVVKGEYKEWAPIILRTPNALEKSPFKWATFLGDQDCLFLSDHDREHASSSP